MSATFPKLQAMYAVHQVVTYPVNPDKRPAITNYDQISSRASAQIVRKFPVATAAGFVAGPRSRITIVDVDSTEEQLVTEMEDRFGVSPLQALTPSGGRHLYYRNNGEARMIRPWPGVDVDILGGGNVVAALSVVPKGKYLIERGSLDDLDRLPTLRTELPRQGPAVIAKGQRNNALFKHCGKIVAHCDTLDQLVDAACHWAKGNIAEPLPEAEVLRICSSAWTYRGGRKRIGQHIVDAPMYASLEADPNTMALFAVLSAENGDRAEFMVADGLGYASGWPRRLVPAARNRLLDLGVIRCIRPARKGAAALYCWALSQ